MIQTHRRPKRMDRFFTPAAAAACRRYDQFASDSDYLANYDTNSIIRCSSRRPVHDQRRTRPPYKSYSWVILNPSSQSIMRERMTIGRVAGKSDDTHGGKLDSETITRKQGKAGTDTERRREREREKRGRESSGRSHTGGAALSSVLDYFPRPSISSAVSQERRISASSQLGPYARAAGPMSSDTCRRCAQAWQLLQQLDQSLCSSSRYNRL